jgi:hypothetical protein
MPVLLLLSYLDRVSKNGEVSAPTPSTQLCIGKVQVLIRGKKNVEKLSRQAGADLCQAQDQLGLPAEAKLILEVGYTLGCAGEDL